MLVQATVFGSTFSINKLAATAGVPPFAYSFWQSLGSAALLAIVVHARGDRVGMTWAHLKSYVVIGGIGIGIPTALLTVVAPKLPAGALTLGLALIPSFTYAASLIIGIEKFGVLGVGGLLIGFAGGFRQGVLEQILERHIPQRRPGADHRARRRWLRPAHGARPQGDRRGHSRRLHHKRGRAPRLRILAAAASRSRQEQ
jgi:hypothetical protein